MPEVQSTFQVSLVKQGHVKVVAPKKQEELRLSHVYQCITGQGFSCLCVKPRFGWWILLAKDSRTSWFFTIYDQVCFFLNNDIKQNYRLLTKNAWWIPDWSNGCVVLILHFPQGSLYYQPKQGTMKGEILQNYLIHLHCLIPWSLYGSRVEGLTWSIGSFQIRWSTGALLVHPLVVPLGSWVKIL